MSIHSLMFHRADWYRPTKGKDATNTQGITGETLKKRQVPCCVQPASASEVNFYMQRSMEVSHTIFTSATDSTTYDWQQGDTLLYSGRTFYIVGKRDLIELGRVVALDVKEYDGPDRRV